MVFLQIVNLIFNSVLFILLIIFISSVKKDYKEIKEDCLIFFGKIIDLERYFNIRHWRGYIKERRS